ncbi:MAG: PAS domain S-box protein, partial [Myxococcales bacterium]|nr:PAS domain S-box protein [Myxococcales bacterium]
MLPPQGSAALGAERPRYRRRGETMSVDAAKEPSPGRESAGPIALESPRVRAKPLGQRSQDGGVCRDLLRHSPAVLYTCRATGDFAATFVSENVETQLGLRASRFTSDPSFWSSRIHPRERDTVLAGLSALFEHDRHVHEYRFLDGHGDYRWMRDELRLLRSAAGEPLEISGYWIDVTSRRELEIKLAEANAILEARLERRTQSLDATSSALEESRARYQWLFESSNAFLCLLDASGIVIESNLRTRRELGLEDAELAERPLWEILGTHTLDAARGIRRRLVRGETIEMELNLRSASGETRCHEVILSMISAGRVRQIQLIGRDVTARRESRRQLEEMRAQLQQAQKMEAIGQLAGGVAHDFNNILTAILNCAFSAREELSEDEPIRSELDEIAEAAERGAALTKQLLAFSRKQVLEAMPIDPNAVLQGMGRMLTRLVGASVRFHFELSEGLLRVLVDPGKLEQVLMNLVTNARDAMPQGGRISIRTFGVEVGPGESLAAELREGRYVGIQIQDTGNGMDAAMMARIFEPFFTTKDEGKGTGLGLSTVFGIVKQSGGHVEVASRVGEGTSFTLYLPATTDSARVYQSTRPLAPELLGEGTILVVDDDDAVRRSIERTLR